MMEDDQSATGFGGQLEMWFPQERSWLIGRPKSFSDNFVDRIKKADRRVCHTVLSERDREREICQD